MPLSLHDANMHLIGYHDAVIGVDWVGIVGMVCSIFLLASYLVLPVDQTNRFHVTTCVVVSIMIMTVSLGCTRK